MPTLQEIKTAIVTLQVKVDESVALEKIAGELIKAIQAKVDAAVEKAKTANPNISEEDLQAIVKATNTLKTSAEALKAILDATASHAQ